MHGADRQRRQRVAGVALPLVLVLLSLTGVLLVQGIAGAAGEVALAGQLAARQQAFVAAENGIAMAIAALARSAGQALPAPATQRFAGMPDASAITECSERPGDTAPAGYGEGDFVLRRIEIASVGRSRQGARVRVVQGIGIIVPVAGAAR
jgi:hypothetical protein